jgi:hypothetical protein
MDPKIEALAKKLLELKKRGVGGEAVNDSTMLDNLLQKHGLSIEDILDEETVKEHEFRYYGPEHKDFIIHVVGVITNTPRVAWKYRPRTKIMFFKTTASQWIQIVAMAEFYWPRYLVEMKAHYEAFMHTNKLYKYGEPDPEHTPTQEELEELERILEKMRGMKPYVFRKQIEA